DRRACAPPLCGPAVSSVYGTVPSWNRCFRSCCAWGGAGARNGGGFNWLKALYSRWWMNSPGRRLLPSTWRPSHWTPNTPEHVCCVSLYAENPGKPAYSYGIIRKGKRASQKLRRRSIASFPYVKNGSLTTASATVVGWIILASLFPI